MVGEEKKVVSGWWLVIRKKWLVKEQHNMTARIRIAGATPPKPSKYRAVRTTAANGLSYASKAEAKRADELDLLTKLHHIRGYISQPRFRLGCPENVYVADFLVFPKKGDPWAEDVKGVQTQKFKRDTKLWKAYGPCKLHVLSGPNTEIINGKT